MGDLWTVAVAPGMSVAVAGNRVSLTASFDLLNSRRANPRRRKSVGSIGLKVDSPGEHQLSAPCIHKPVIK
jgi:hypothetical protein